MRTRPLRASDLPAFTRLQSTSFAIPHDLVGRWVEVSGPENVRVLEDQGLVGGAMVVPMGMFLGGQPVPAWGVAGVAVDPARRGQGGGVALMQGLLDEAAEAEAALSVLYASTRGLYRRVGYDVAGSYLQATVATERLREVGLPGAWRRVQPEDHPAIEARHAELARHRDGALVRGPYLWHRVRERRGVPAEFWMLDGVDGPAAWVAFHQDREPGNPWVVLTVVDLGYVDLPALRAAAGFLGAFSSMARTLRAPTLPGDPLVDLLAELRFEIKLVETWLARITHLPAAVAARGWPPLDLVVDLDVHDAGLPHHAGRWRLVLEGGAGRLERGGSGAVWIDAGGLAGWFTGHATPHALQSRGRLKGPEDALRKLAWATAGAPHMVDFF